ncbi:MAG TPA: DMT family transporter [Polyangiaceae bacterium]|jgi:drug/metabolite transporter (DMT)-like permease
MSRPRASDLFVVILAAVAFATSSPLAKSAVGIPPLLIAAGRCAVAAAAIAVARPRETVAAIGALGSKHRGAMIIAGLLLAGHFALFLWGLVSTSLPAAVALVSLEPLSVVLAAWIAFRIRPTRGEAAGVVIASVGALVVASGAGSGEHRVIGDVMVLGAVVLFGAYVAFARGLRESMPVLPYAAAVYGVSALALAPFALRGDLGVGAPTWSWIAVVALGLVPTLVGHTLVQSAARRLSPAIVGLVSPGETVGSLVIGAIFLRAIPSGKEAAGTALVLAGATVAVLGGRKA